jgi:hypothetical protein
MNNEWLNTLRSRMENHEEEVPEGLWDDISNELFSKEEENKLVTGLVPTMDAEEDEKVINTKPEIKSSWLYRIGGIAAAAVLIFVMMKVLPDESQKKISQNSSELHKETGVDLSLNSAGNQEDIEGGEKSKTEMALGQDYLNTVQASSQKVTSTKFEEEGRKRAGNDEKTPELVKTPEEMETILLQEENKMKEMPLANNDIKNKETEKEVNKTEKELPEKYADNTKMKEVKHRSEKKWMLSVLTGNASSNSAEQQFHGYASVNGKPMSFEQVWAASEYVEDPLTQILLANQNKPVEARIRHKVPVTFGLSMYYNLGEKWGIGTGVNYTKLSSELHSGSNDNYIKGEQKVHYIGIPVQVNYNVLQKGRFTGYITGGALVEKPISGSITTSYVVNDEVKETLEEKLEHKPLSFSVNTAVGLQMKVVNRLGIYAEPGIGYHFKDENSPNTIYKEKPLHFNVKFGIRLLID